MGVDNWFISNADSPSLATNATTAGKVGDLARNVGIVNANGTISQTERLLTARARYGQKALLTGTSKDLGGNRGQHAYIKLLTSKTQADSYLSPTQDRDVTFKDLVGPDGAISKMADPGGKSTSGYDSFLLTGVQCAMSEKVQITEVFGDNEVIYYFGRQPLIFNFSGILIDSPDNSWFAQWVKLFNDFMRGTQLARNYELIKIVLPNMEVTGSISSFSYSQDASRDTDIPFTFQFIAKIVVPIEAEPIGMPTTNTLQFVDFSQVAKFTTQSQLNSLKGKVAMLTAKVSDPTASLREKGAALAALGSGAGGGSGSLFESLGKTLGTFPATIDGWTKAQDKYVADIQKSAMYQTVTSSLNGVRTNLFSPVYGILSSLTKLVSNTFNSASKLFNNLINPVRNILRDITNISNKAIALVNLVNSSIKGFGRNVKGQLKGTVSDYKEALKTLKKATGTIASSPASLSQSLKIMFSAGVLANDTPFLRTPAKLTFTSPTLSGLTRPASKIVLLQAIGVYSVEGANTL